LNERSPHIYLALTLALNPGMRDAEIKTRPTAPEDQHSLPPRHNPWCSVTWW
jgi:hypothetical protein